MSIQATVYGLSYQRLILQHLPRHLLHLVPDFDPVDSPPHYAVLKMSGKNLQGFEQPLDIQISIDGFDLLLPQNLSSGPGNGLDPIPFQQDAAADAAVEKLQTGLTSHNPPPVPLAARMQLSRANLTPLPGPNTRHFERYYPELPDSQGFCADKPSINNPKTTRVEAVTWSQSLSSPLTLTLHHLNGTGTDIPLTIIPAPNENRVALKIVNQVAEALYDSNPAHNNSHLPAYRWFYSLSQASTCRAHYYPIGPAGGNRCPQKLYTE